MLEGQVLGERYRLVRELGEGTTARTFLAIEHGQLGVRKAVAVKILDHRVLSDPHRLEAVVTAARSLAKICHPNVVDVRDLYQGSDATAIVLDYIPGTTLLSILARCTQLRRPPPTAVALRLIADACFGVQALHECEGSDGPPLLHHALRPSNILVGYSGCTLITDGGLAANAEQITIDADLSSGMAQFAAPESLPGAELLGLDTVDERADIYALGVCLYVLLTLRFPYDQEELGELVAAKQQGDNVPARGRNKSISERIELLLDRALSPMPLDRHDSARELGGEIEALQGELRLTASHHLVASWLRDLLGAKIEAKQAVLRQLVAAESPPLVAQPSVMIVDHGSAEQSTSDPLEPSLAGIASSEHPPSRELSLNQRAASEDEPPLHLSDDEFAPRGPLSELPSEFPELDPLQNRRDIEQPPLEPRSSFDPSGLSGDSDAGGRDPFAATTLDLDGRQRKRLTRCGGVLYAPARSERRARRFRAS
jgi:serine/threonine protein kinase